MRLARSSCSGCRADCGVGLDDRRADGERHGAGGGAPRAAGARRLGRRGARACAARRRVRVLAGDEAHVTVVARAAAARPRPRAGRRRARRRPGPRCAPTRWPRRWPTATGRRSSAPRRATSTPARSTRWPRSPPPRASTARGCTSTAPSGCGRRPARRCADLVAGAADADSWATDGHKWLNVPYDCGVVAVARPRRPRRGDGHDARPTSSRRRRRDALELRLGARVLAARPRVRGLRGAALARALGRGGPGRALLRARAPAGRALGAAGGVEVLNDVVLNQVLLRFGDDATTDAVDRRASRPTGRAGSAAPAGAAGRRCASRCRAGRPPRPTSTAAPTRSVSAARRAR